MTLEIFFQRFSKKEFFAIFRDFLRNIEEGFFEKHPPKIDVRHQFYTIMHNNSCSTSESDFSEGPQKHNFYKQYETLRFLRASEKPSTGGKK